MDRYRQPHRTGKAEAVLSLGCEILYSAEELVEEILDLPTHLARDS